jgi:hypothetical protein
LEENGHFARRDPALLRVLGLSNVLRQFSGRPPALVFACEKDNRAIAFTTFNNHAYFYESAKDVCRDHASDGQEAPQLLRNEKRGELPPFDEWRPWKGETSPSHF